MAISEQLNAEQAVVINGNYILDFREELRYL